MALSEDEFTRVSDPRVRGRAVTVLVAASGVAVLALGIGALRGALSAGGRSPAAVDTAPHAPLAALPTPAPHEPIVGFGFDAVDDPAARQLVVFGGVDSYDQTWVFEDSRWVLAAQGGPAGRFGAAAAYDPASARMVVFGGRLAPGEVAGDTWAWDGSGWSRLDAGGGAGDPPQGEGSVMAWDPRHHEMVLVAGAGGTGTYGWDGFHWRRRPGPDLGSGTQLIGMAVDPVSGQLIAVGCCDENTGASRTFAWDGPGWSYLASPRAPQLVVTLAVDPMSERILMIGDTALEQGRVWQWTGRSWTSLPRPAPPVFPSAAVSSATIGHLVVLGSPVEPVQGHPQPLELWLWSGAQWVHPFLGSAATVPHGVRPTPIPTPPFESP